MGVFNLAELFDIEADFSLNRFWRFIKITVYIKHNVGNGVAM